MVTKMELVQTLIIEEVIRKRDVNIRAFRKGLFILGFLNLCRDHPLLTKELFVYTKQNLTASVFLSLLEPGLPPRSQLSQTTYTYFQQYIEERGGCGSERSKYFSSYTIKFYYVKPILYYIQYYCLVTCPLV